MSTQRERRREFRQIDVFTAEPYVGNPLAVVVDGSDLTTDQMQRFANWTNLSETTFLLLASDEGADYQVRIFTPVGELPFAGHPTLGSCQVWLDSGGLPARPDVIVQQCQAGLITIRHDGSRLAFAAPPLLRSGAVDRELVGRIAVALGIEPSSVVDTAWIDNGPGWVGVLLGSADEVLALQQPSFESLSIGVVGPYATGPHALELRAFFPKQGAMAEDPVTGSLNASVAQWMLASGRVRLPYVASQGTVLGRAGRVHVSEADGQIWVGGDTVTCVTGTVAL